MSNTFKSYALVGGQPVRIDPLTVTEPGTTFAEEGCAFNPVVCNVSGALTEKTESITDNGTVVLTPPEGKIGFSKVTINTDLSGKLEEGNATATANGETVLEPSEGNIGFSKVTVTTEVYALKTFDHSPAAVNGTYIFTAADSEDNTVVGICVIASGAVDNSYGDGTFAVDTSGDTPVIAWTPSVTAESVTVWYAASVESA